MKLVCSIEVHVHFPRFLSWGNAINEIVRFQKSISNYLQCASKLISSSTLFTLARNGGGVGVTRSPNPTKPGNWLWTQGGNKHHEGNGENDAPNSQPPANIDVFQEREGGELILCINLPFACLLFMAPFYI